MGLMDNDNGIVRGTMQILSIGVLADVRFFSLAAWEGGRGTGPGYVAALIECERCKA